MNDKGTLAMGFKTSTRLGWGCPRVKLAEVKPSVERAAATAPLPVDWRNERRDSLRLLMEDHFSVVHSTGHPLVEDSTVEMGSWL